jgi:predicted amidohydrolase YtcJ
LDVPVEQELDKAGSLTLRIGYSLFPQVPKKELDDFRRWAATLTPREGSPFFRLVGAGEMLAFSAADFEDFKEPRPDLPSVMEQELEEIVRFLVSKSWPFRLHATYGESIHRELAIFERVARDEPEKWKQLRWFIDHAETVSKEDIKRIEALNGGIAIQHRMSFQGEYFVQRYGADSAANSPPIRSMVGSASAPFGSDASLPVGAGTDGTRVATYNPWVSLSWLISGKSVGGLPLTNTNKISRPHALYLWTRANAFFAHREAEMGQLIPGQLADFAVLRQDYFGMEEDQVKDVEVN